MPTPAGNPSDPDELAGFEGWLARSLYRFDCPDAHTLGEYALELLGPEDRTAIAGHVLECDGCRAELTTFREFLAQPTRMSDSLLQRARRRMAMLLAPLPGPTLGALRGSTDESVRIYQADGVTITIAPGPRSGTLIGLVVSEELPPETLEGRAIRLVPDTGQAITVALDDLGNFEVEALAPGVYALEFDLPDDEVIIIEPLQVR